MHLPFLPILDRPFSTLEVDRKDHFRIYGWSPEDVLVLIVSIVICFHRRRWE